VQPQNGDVVSLDIGGDEIQLSVAVEVACSDIESVVADREANLSSEGSLIDDARLAEVFENGDGALAVHGVGDCQIRLAIAVEIPDDGADRVVICAKVHGGRKRVGI